MNKAPFFSGEESATSFHQSGDRCGAAIDGGGDQDGPAAVRQVQEEELHVQPDPDAVRRRAHDHLRPLQRVRKPVEVLLREREAIQRVPRLVRAIILYTAVASPVVNGLSGDASTKSSGMLSNEFVCSLRKEANLNAFSRKINCRKVIFEGSLHSSN